MKVVKGTNFQLQDEIRSRDIIYNMITIVNKDVWYIRKLSQQILRILKKKYFFLFLYFFVSKQNDGCNYTFGFNYFTIYIHICNICNIILYISHLSFHLRKQKKKKKKKKNSTRSKKEKLLGRAEINKTENRKSIKPKVDWFLLFSPY